MKILGIGSIFSRGFGVEALQAALEEGWRPPVAIDAPCGAGGKRLVYQVDMDGVPDRSLLKKIRRADRLSKMSVLAAANALADSGVENLAEKRLGIILSTAFGAHVTTFDFLDGMLEFGEANVSPTSFSNSVHNAAASYISSSLNIQGPTLTLTQFRFSFTSALQLASCWLEQGRADYLLVGAVDQYGDVLGYVSDQKLQPVADGKIKPFVFSPTGQIPGEGGLFFLLGRDNAASAYCSIASVTTCETERVGQLPDLCVIDADGWLPDESAYLSALPPGIPVAAYSPLFGSMMSGSAFNMAVAALMLKQQHHYAVPENTNPHNLSLINRTMPAEIGSIGCLAVNCHGQRAETLLVRE